MKSIKKKTPYGANLTEFEAKVGRFKLRAHIFEKTGELSYELNLGNKLQRFANFSNISKCKKSLEQDLERLNATKKFISEVEMALKEKDHQEIG
jgi:hypothetical protein